MGILDFLFPKYCVNCRKLGSYLCPNCFAYISFDDSGTCLVCRRPAIDGITHPACKSRHAIDGAFASIAYKGVVRKLIYNFKYKPYLTDLQHVLVDLFYEGLIQKEAFDRAYRDSSIEKIMLAPIPLHSSRLKSRGYNQAEILAKGLSEKLNLRMFPVLERIKKTDSQIHLKQKERKENIAGAFAVRKNAQEILKGAGIFLIDDVLTTGSTLLEASRMLKRAGAKKVWGLALARD